MRLNKKLAAVAVAVGLVAGGTTLATAAIPDSSTGMITGCRSNHASGNLRVIDKQDGASCHSYESEITWPSSTAPGNFSPELHVEYWPGKLAEFGGTTVIRELNCPSGEKLIFAHGGLQSGTTSNWPGSGLSGTSYSSGMNERPYEYIETSGVITGVKFRHVETQGTGLEVAYSCSA